MTNYHDAVGLSLAKKAAQSCEIESVGQGGIGFSFNPEALGHDLGRLRGTGERAG